MTGTRERLVVPGYYTKTIDVEKRGNAGEKSKGLREK
jgi:hypothetical protein